MRLAARLTFLLMSVGLAEPALAVGTLYGASTNGELIRIDTTTGAGTLAAAFPPLCFGGLSIGVTEIEFDNRSRRAFAQCLGAAFSGFEFDVSTGAVIGGEIPNGAAFNGLEVVGNTWYGVSITLPTAPSELRTIDPFTGVSTLIGPTGIVGPIAGLALHKRSGVVYGIAGGPGPANLYTIDLATGAATVVGSTGIQAGSLEFGPDGRLYAGGTGPDAGELFVIDPRTGASTLVGPTGFSSGLGGLALVDCNDPANPFLNCGFETGDFTSWSTQDLTNPFFSLRVGGAGVTPGFGLFTSAPTEGGLAALHGFDGDGPGHIRVAQDVAVPGGGRLEFDYRAGWDLLTFCPSPPCADRTFNVLVEPAGGGAPLATFGVLAAPGGTSVGDTGDQVGRVNLGAFAGQTVRVAFDWFVPEDRTGPAFFQLDNVRFAVPRGFFTITPCRVIDTRDPAGPLGGPALNAGADRPFTIVGTCAIPSSAQAVSVNIAVTGSTAPGNIRLHAGGTPVPMISSINYGVGQTRSNNAILGLNATGQLAAFVAQASGTVNFILDVNGYFQ